MMICPRSEADEEVEIRKEYLIQEHSKVSRGSVRGGRVQDKEFESPEWI